jgi:hypothetical protein
MEPPLTGGNTDHTAGAGDAAVLAAMEPAS